MHIKLFTLIFLLFLASCTKRNLVYFSNIETLEFKTSILNQVKIQIQKDDLLSISVSTLSPESNALFNSGVMANSTLGSGATPNLKEGYLVNEQGFINFPVIGLIQVAGLTKEEVAIKLTSEIVKFVKNPIINVQITNFKITVLGEVNSPATITVPTDKVTLLQAIALAGDLTVNGKRENIALIREKDGIRKVVRINLNNKEVLNSPYFYLQQNDVIYVEPDKAKVALTSSTQRNFQFGISIVVSLITVLTLVLSRV